MKINLSNKADFCCGCGACEAACPKKIIELKKSEEDGFIYPVICDNTGEECMNCGLCVNVCPMLSEREGNQVLNTYGFVNRDKIAKKSASGGMFPAIACYVLSKGGVVYACILDDENKAITERTESIDSLERMLCSKYVQCDTNRKFYEIKQDLDSSRLVLYCSTPCQVAGLMNYLKKPYENLITVDLFCHGMPSPGLWQEYLKHLAQVHHDTPKNIVFRDKKLGWANCIGHYEANGMHEFGLLDDLYWRAFVQMKTYQNSCYICPYAKMKRVGDFSIGDYWGVEQEHPEIDTTHGVSAVLVNSSKGREIFEEIKKSKDVFDTTFEKIYRNNSVLVKPASKPEVRDKIYDLYALKRFDKIFKLLRPYSKWKLYKKKVKRILHDSGLTIVVDMYNYLKMKE